YGWTHIASARPTAISVRVLERASVLRRILPVPQNRDHCRRVQRCRAMCDDYAAVVRQGDLCSVTCTTRRHRHEQSTHLGAASHGCTCRLCIWPSLLLARLTFCSPFASLSSCR